MSGRREVPKTTPIPKSLKVFVVSGGDVNSKRMIETLKQIPSLHAVTTVVDVHRTPYSGIKSVPSILVDGRTLMSGTAAFEYLRGFDSTLADPPGVCSLEYSNVDGSCDNLDSHWYGTF